MTFPPKMCHPVHGFYRMAIAITQRTLCLCASSILVLAAHAMPSLYTRATGTLLVQIMGYSAIFMLNRLYTRPSFSQILPITCHRSARHFMAAISLPQLALTWRAACHCTNLAHLRTRQPYNA